VVNLALIPPVAPGTAITQSAITHPHWRITPQITHLSQQRLLHPQRHRISKIAIQNLLRLHQVTILLNILEISFEALPSFHLLLT
jgi:hypothetical protein